MKLIPRLSAAEWEVMKIIWARHPCAAQEIINTLSNKKTWEGATIKTLLHRLVVKRAVHYERMGRRYIYTPAFKYDECCGMESELFLTRVFDDDLSKMLSHFARCQTLMEEDVIALKNILRNKSKR
jgi:BlaI family penicillinase repressor